MSWVLAPGEVDEARRLELGGKGGNLLRLTRAGFPVPAWVVVPAAAFDAVLAQAGGQAILRARLAGVRFAEPDTVRVAAAEIQRALTAAANAFDWTGLLADCLAAFPPDAYLAARSSGTVEDSRAASFAGQFESFLFVRGDQALRAAITGCWLSAFSERILTYEHLRGVDPAMVRVAVVVQQMINARASGVLFTRDVTQQGVDRSLISAGLGIGTGVVQGSTECDTFGIDRRTRAVASHIAAKRTREVLAGGGGLTTEAVPPEEQSRPCLSESEIQRLADIGVAIERELGLPQDIEWASDSQGIWVLQTRPITTIPTSGDRPILWDNSNIVESYPGVTTPLTFSFAREAYATVYPQALAALGVPKPIIDNNRQVFGNMLGLMQGRFYYNLNNWYAALALLPGFRITARYMELMMGLRDPQAREVVEASVPPETGASSGAAGLAYLALRIVIALLQAPSRNQAFLRSIDAICGPAEQEDLASLSPAVLVSRFGLLRRKLLGHWIPPIMNDSISMLFYGVLQRLLAHRTLADEAGLGPELLSGLPDLLTTAPARDVAAMAELVREDPGLRVLFAANDDESLVRAVLEGGEAPVLADKVRAYLLAYGCRSPGELKLEEASLRADPTPLFASIRAYATHEIPTGEATEVEGRRRYLAALARARDRLSWPLGLPSPRYLVFRLVLGRARLHLRDRENMRFGRARVFGLARDLFLAMGRRLTALGELDDPRDVFYLEVEEVLGYITGSGTTADIRALTQARRQEFAAYRAGPSPPPRFQTIGPAFHDIKSAVGAAFAPSGPPSELKGVGCQPGRVRGRARIVLDPAKATIERGDIVVARQTDPGWVVVFPLAAGLLVERGGPLSHAAIVSRELGIPAVVGIPDLLERVRDGDWVELDGAAGVAHVVTGSPERLNTATAEAHHG